MRVDGIDRVLFVGAGTMGAANSLVAAVSGYEVVLHDAREESLVALSERHDEIGAFLVAKGYCTPDELEAGRTRASWSSGLVDAAVDVDLVSESVFEDLALKRDLHRRIDEVAPPRAIQTTNTSALLVSEIEDVVARGERFAALHSHLGALLVDIVAGPRTTAATIETLRGYVRSLGAVPLVLRREHPGYVFNAMNGSVLAMALRLVIEGRSDRDAVDRAWMADRGAPMGPFGMMDLFGLDLVLDAWRHPSDDPEREAFRPAAISFLAEQLDRGRLGLKNGLGFYDYPSPAFEEPDFSSSAPVSDEAVDALRSALIVSAVELARADVVGLEDIDRAWVVATGLEPGPIEMVDRVGVDDVVAMLHEQAAAGLIGREAAGVTAAWLQDRR